MGGVFVKKWKMCGCFFCKKVDLSSMQSALCAVSVFFYFTFYLLVGVIRTQRTPPLPTGLLAHLRTRPSALPGPLSWSIKIREHVWSPSNCWVFSDLSSLLKTCPLHLSVAASHGVKGCLILIPTAPFDNRFIVSQWYRSSFSERRIEIYARPKSRKHLRFRLYIG